MAVSLIDQLGWREYVGRDMGARTGYPVRARDIRRYRLAIEDFSAQHEDALTAPLGYVYWATHDATVERPVAESSEEGFLGFLGIPDIPGIFTLGWVRGADDYEFYEPVRVGDEVTAAHRIVDIVEKDGRSGKLILITTELRYTNQAGALLALHRLTMIGSPRKEG